MGQNCPFRDVLDQIGDKWTFLVFSVLEGEPRRFNQIRRLIGGISQRVLTKKLRDLERDGYVTRTVFPERPPRVEYDLTPLGRSILEPIKFLLEWADKASPEINRAREAFDRSQAPAAPVAR